MEKKELLTKLYPVAPKEELLAAFPECSKTSIRAYASKLGIRRKVRNSKSDISWILQNSNISHYWLGFILADGNFSNLGNIRLYLAGKDKNKICEFSNLCSSNIHESTTKDGRSRIGTTIYDPQVCSELFSRFQLKKGYPKTYFPPNLTYFNSKESFVSFLVGFIDGNGSIGVYDVLKRNKPTKLASLVLCNHENWYPQYDWINQQISKYFNIKYLIARSQVRKEKIRLTYRNKKFLRDLNTYIKTLGIPYMARKWNKLDNL